MSREVKRQLFNKQPLNGSAYSFNQPKSWLSLWGARYPGGFDLADNLVAFVDDQIDCGAFFGHLTGGWGLFQYQAASAIFVVGERGLSDL